MAFDENLAERIRSTLKQNHVSFEEKKMFGGVCYMVDDKMCVGVIKENLMVRTDPENYLHLLLRTGCRHMDFSGQSMKGFLYVAPEGIDMDKDLDEWISFALEYNPRAKATAKKGKKSK
jgi:hypothetical protein